MSDLHTTGRWKAMQQACRLRDMRANARCGICHRPIDYDLPSTDPWSYEADHIRPASRYPELFFSYDNVQASHKRCNRKKHDDERQRRSIGEWNGGDEGCGDRSREW